jgi:hypothetical protein
MREDDATLPSDNIAMSSSGSQRECGTTLAIGQLDIGAEF